MQRSHFHHEPKSKFAYAIDSNTVDLRVLVQKGTCRKIELLHGDPFMWMYSDETNTYTWNGELQASSPLLLETTFRDQEGWSIRLKVPTKRLRYAFLVDDTYLVGPNSIIDVTQNIQAKYDFSMYYNFPYILEVDTFHAPSWVKDTLWYSIFPDRFCNLDNQQINIQPWGSTLNVKNNQFFGGNLKGITSKLDYLSSLGFNGIYITPIFESPSAHKYDTINYFKIDPMFGTIDDLKTLVKEAHKRGIKVVLDAVFNHCSVHHPFFQDVITFGKESPYYSCFYIKKHPFSELNQEELHRLHSPKQANHSLSYETFSFSPRMPKINTEDPFMRKHLLDCATFWIKECDIDGWRLDVSNEVSHDFWRVFRKEVKAIKEDCFILGENWDDATPWLQGDQHDGVMNYTFLHPIHQLFEQSPRIDTSTLIDTIHEILFLTPKGVTPQLFNFVDSHDTIRISSLLSNNYTFLKSLYVFLYSLPGSPSVYYGGEIALEGQKDPDNRRCMRWLLDNDEQDFYEFMIKLGRMYHQEKVFRSIDFRFLECTSSVLVYQKDQTIFYINKTPLEQSITNPFQDKKAFNLFTNEILSTKTAIIPPFSFLILQQLSPKTITL
jgi:cyclomaltodextrinase / maltogenic alpha-amylase / neopullulanase